MKRTLKLLATVCACLGLALALGACSSSQPSSSSSREVLDTAEDQYQLAPTYVLIIGKDSRYNTAEDPSVTKDAPSYSDVIMLARIDPDTHRIGLLSIPRDTKCTYKGATVKVNDAYHQDGAEGLKTAVQSITGVKADYYLTLGFSTYTEFIDELGGALADVPFDMSVSEPISGGTVNLKAGDNQLLVGTDALGLGRQRKMYASEGEACRQIRNRQIVENLITKIAAADGGEEAAQRYAELAVSYCETDMPVKLLQAFIADFMEHSDEITFQSGSGSYSVGQDETGEWYAEPDPDVYGELMDAMENGGSLTDILPLPEVAKAEE